MWGTASESGYPLSGSDSTTASAVGGKKAHDAGLPRALGYLRKHLLMTETEVRYAEERLAYFARVEGFQLDKVYVEEVETWPAAFEALVEAAVSDELSAVLLPSMLHFAVLGPPANIKQHFEHLTRTRVLAVSELVSYRPGEAAS
jgi:hypothetical protein